MWLWKTYWEVASNNWNKDKISIFLAPSKIMLWIDFNRLMTRLALELLFLSQEETRLTRVIIRVIRYLIQAQDIKLLRWNLIPPRDSKINQYRVQRRLLRTHQSTILRGRNLLSHLCKAKGLGLQQESLIWANWKIMDFVKNKSLLKLLRMAKIWKKER